MRLYFISGYLIKHICHPEIEDERILSQLSFPSSDVILPLGFILPSFVSQFQKWKQIHMTSTTKFESNFRIFYLTFTAQTFLHRQDFTRIT